MQSARQLGRQTQKFNAGGISREQRSHGSVNAEQLNSWRHKNRRNANPTADSKRFERGDGTARHVGKQPIDQREHGGLDVLRGGTRQHVRVRLEVVEIDDLLQIHDDRARIEVDRDSGVLRVCELAGDETLGRVEDTIHVHRQVRFYNPEVIEKSEHITVERRLQSVDQGLRAAEFTLDSIRQARDSLATDHQLCTGDLIIADRLAGSCLRSLRAHRADREVERGDLVDEIRCDCAGERFDRASEIDVQRPGSDSVNRRDSGADCT